MSKQNSKTETKENSVFKKLIPYMGKKKALIPIAMIFSAIAAVINVIPFYYVWRITQDIFATGTALSACNIKYYAAMVFACSFAGILAYFIALMSSHLAAFEVEITLKKQGFAKVLNMPLGFFNTQSSGKIRKVINDGAENTHTFLAHQLPDLAGAIITPFIVIAIFLIFDWRLGFAALVNIIVSFVIMSMMMSTTGKDFQKKYMDALEEMSNESVEYVRSIPVVKTFGQSVKSFTRFYNSIISYKELSITYTRLWTRPWSLYSVIVQSTAFFLLPVAVFIIGNGASVGSILSSFILYLLIAPVFSMAFMRSMYFTQQKNMALQSIDRYNNLFQYAGMDYPKNGAKFDAQDIEFKNVSFSYDGKKNVLENISFKVKKGETLALVGVSGGGKTTIARLAARFWDVRSGEVLIGGKNIKDYAKEDLMANISFVFQNTELFKTSLGENITFGRTDITDAQIENALVKSRAKEIIDYLDDGLETVIGKKGTYLSGGEQQRIALARAFLKDAPIILLDEATAFADPENEHLIQAALKDLSTGKTSIMIAHRMTTIKNADHIGVVESGKIIEYGTHDELIAQGKKYKKMWNEYQRAIDWNIKKELK